MQWNKLEEASLRQTLASKFNIFSLSAWCSWQLAEAVWGCRNPGASPRGPARVRHIWWTEKRGWKTRATTDASDSTLVCPHPKSCDRWLALRNWQALICQPSHINAEEHLIALSSLFTPHDWWGAAGSLSRQSFSDSFSCPRRSISGEAVIRCIKLTRQCCQSPRWARDRGDWQKSKGHYEPDQDCVRQLTADDAFLRCFKAYTFFTSTGLRST